jgi:hypothetical protein
MPIKAVILDVRGTMLRRSCVRGAYSVVSEVPELIDRLRRRDIAIFAASDTLHDAGAARELLRIDSDKILTSAQVGAHKGKKKFVEYICARYALSPNELLYLGDRKDDYQEAVRGAVAFFLAAWSNRMLGSGIPVESPMRFADVVETFFLKQNLWYYRVDATDGLGRGVKVRSLLDPDRARDRGITALLKSKGATGAGTIRGFDSSEYISLHLFASVYLEGLHHRGAGTEPIWCLYPGHAGQYASVLTGFTAMVSQQFQAQFIENLIKRHTTSIRSSYARPRGYSPNMDNQLQTIHLNRRARKGIRGQTVIVLDDFTTRSYCFETARNFFLNAGAQAVICIAVGKYARAYYARYPRSGLHWNSFAPTTLTESDFATGPVGATFDSDALTIF